MLPLFTLRSGRGVKGEQSEARSKPFNLGFLCDRARNSKVGSLAGLYSNPYGRSMHDKSVDENEEAKLNDVSL